MPGSDCFFRHGQNLCMDQKKAEAYQNKTCSGGALKQNYQDLHEENMNLRGGKQIGKVPEEVAKGLKERHGLITRALQEKFH